MPPDFETLGSLPGAIAATGAVLSGAYALGGLCLREKALGTPRNPAILLRITTGLVLLAWLTVVLGSLKLLAGWGLALLLGLTGVCGLSTVGIAAWQYFARRHRSPRRDESRLAVPRTRPRRSRPAIRAARGGSSRVETSELFRPWRFWLASIAAIAGLVTLGPALCYPTGWDELVYHHELPRRWLAEGWPTVYRDLPYAGFPSAAELLFWLMGPLDYVIAPRLLMWCCWIMGLASVFCLLRRRLATSAAAVMTAAFGLSGTLLMISQNCYVESLLLPETAALLLAIESRSLKPDWRHAALVGLLAGGAAAVKLTGAVITLLPMVWYAIQLVRGRMSFRRSARLVAMFLAVAAAVAFPFYLRPWLATGNPFYPYNAQWFTSDPATLEMSRFHHALGAAFGVHTPAAFFVGPILLAAELNADVHVYDGSFGWQLLLVLFLGAVALLDVKVGRRRRWLVLWPALMAAGLYVFWFVTAQQARFAIPAVLGLVLLAASGLQRIHGSWRTLVVSLLAVATLMSLPYRTSGHYFGSWLAALGIVSRADYVAISTGGRDASDRFYLPLVKALGELTPPDARLMVLFEHRGFYLPRQHEIGTPLFQEANFTPPEEYSDPARVLAHLREQRVTHVVFPNAPAGPDQAPGIFDRQAGILPQLGALTNQGALQVVWKSERYFLLKVSPVSKTSDP